MISSESQSPTDRLFERYSSSVHGGVAAPQSPVPAPKADQTKGPTAAVSADAPKPAGMA